jgi:hypothetical protein
MYLTLPKTDFVWKPFPGVASLLTYQHWNSNEPSFLNKNEYCLQMVSHGYWNDWPCNSVTGSLCEVDYPL